MPIKNIPVRIKLFLSYLMSFTFALLIIGGISYYWLSDIVITQSEDSYRKELATACSTIDRKINELSNLANQLSQEGWVNKIARAAKDELYSGELNQLYLQDKNQGLLLNKVGNEFLSMISLYFINNDLVLSSSGQTRFDFFIEDAFRVEGMGMKEWKNVLQMQNGTVILPETSINSYGRSSKGIVYIQPLHVQDIRSARILMIAFIDATAIENIMKEFINKGVGISITDNKKNVVFSYNMAADAPLVDGETTGADTVGKSYLFLQGKSAQIGWDYNILVPKKLILSQVNKIRQMIIIMITISVIIGFLLSRYLAVVNYRPIQSTVSMIQEKILPGMAQTGADEFEFIQKTLLSILQQGKIMEEKWEEHKPELKDFYMRQLLEGNENCLNSKFTYTLNMLGISFPFSFYCCCTIAFSSSDCGDRVDRLSEEFIKHSIIIYRIGQKPEKTTLVCNFQDRDTLLLCSNSLQEIIGGWRENSVTIAFGSIVDHINHVSSSYKEAEAAMQYSFVRHDNRVVFSEEIRNRESYTMMEEAHIIQNKLKCGDYEKAIGTFKGIIEKTLKETTPSSIAVKNLFFNAEIIALKVVEELMLDSSMKSDPAEVYSLPVLDDMMQRIEKIYWAVCTQINERKNSSNRNMMEAILQYINENYSDSMISLSSVANTFSISPSYLSKFFKEQCGCNFLDYMNQLRIKKAKELLSGSMMGANIVEIAKEVGFSNDVTFRRLFIKYEGVTPSQFKETIQ